MWVSIAPVSVLVSQTVNPSTSCFDLIYLSVSLCSHALTVATGPWLLLVTMVTCSQKEIWTRTFRSVQVQQKCRRRSSLLAGGRRVDYVRLICTQDWEARFCCRQEEQRRATFPSSNNSGNAEFPAVAAHPNQSCCGSLCGFLQSLEQITAYLISSTMAVDLKGISLSGGNQCQIDPLHALVHP